MFFCAYIGRGAGVANWMARVEAHAEWAGLVASTSVCVEMHGGRTPALTAVHSGHASPAAIDTTASVLMAVAIGPPHCSPRVVTREDGDALVLTPSRASEDSSADTDTNEAGASRTTDRRTNAIRLRCRSDAGMLTVAVPPASPDHCFYTRVDGGFMLGDDLRLMLRFSEMALDDRGVFSLLRYGAIPAPLSLVKDVSRIPCGHRLTLCTDGALPRIDRAYEVASIGESSLKPGEADRRFLEALDEVVAASPPHSAVYFSGGVDSSLIAWRCAERGRKDVHLINYRFQENDPDGMASRRIADLLNLPFEQVRYDPAQIPLMLDSLPHDYSFPFGDASAIPTNLLVRASIERLGRIPLVLEGTGADGGYASGTCLGQWSAVSRIPRWMRGIVSAAYRPLALWRIPSDGSGPMRAVRRTLQDPLPRTMLSSNLLETVAYRTPRTVHRAIIDAFDSCLLPLCDGLVPEGELSLIDLIHIGAGQFAAKSFDPLRMRGVQGVYPFLEPDMVSLAVALPWPVKSDGRGSKGMLKRLLGQRLPIKEVYRKKTGFTPPFARMLGRSDLQAFMHDVVSSPSNPFLAYVDQRMLERITDHTRAGGALSSSAIDFAWTMMFLTGWWSGLGRSRP